MKKNTLFLKHKIFLLSQIKIFFIIQKIKRHSDGLKKQTKILRRKKNDMSACPLQNRCFPREIVGPVHDVEPGKSGGKHDSAQYINFLGPWLVF